MPVGSHIGVVRRKAWWEWLQKRMVGTEPERGKTGNLEEEFSFKSRGAIKWGDTLWEHWPLDTGY